MEKKNEKEERKKVGLLCLFLGGAFLVVGLVFFVLVNWINIYAKKTTATIMNSIGVTTSDGKDVLFLELMYNVGNTNVTTNYTYRGVLHEGEGFIPIYYDARDPKRVVEAGWNFEPVFLALIGLAVFLLGLYYRGITDFGIVEMKKPGETAPESAKKTYEAREKIGNGLFFSIDALISIAFGLYMVLVKHNPWMWFFVGIGGLALIYFSFLLVPALIDLHMLKVAKKFKGQVVDTEKLLEEPEKEDSGDSALDETEEKKKENKTLKNKDTKDK